MERSPLLDVVFLVKLDDLIHFICRAKEHWAPLMDFGWLNVEYGHGASRCQTTCVLHNESHRVTLIQQSQLQKHPRVITTTQTKCGVVPSFPPREITLCMYMYLSNWFSLVCEWETASR